MSINQAGICGEVGAIILNALLLTSPFHSTCKPQLDPAEFFVQSGSSTSLFMTLSVSEILLRAKELEIQELKRLDVHIQLSGILGHMVHVLQSERGASSIYLASSGKRFQQKRDKLILESETIARLLLVNIEQDLEGTKFSNARIVSLMAWTILGLEALPGLRDSITRFKITGDESVAAFSHIIAGLISLIFELADVGGDPDISRSMVSLFYLIEGKEMAGQERATGALAYGSGACDSQLKQRLLHLIDAQDRSFRIFLEFADDNLKLHWHEIESTPCSAKLIQMRQIIRNANPDATIDSELSDTWFNCCSERITYMWKIQLELVNSLQKRCKALITDAQFALKDSEGLLRSLKENPPARSSVLDLIINPEMPTGHFIDFQQPGTDNEKIAPHSILDVLLAQSKRLTDIEAELASTRRALNERKNIERAKGILMARYKFSEDKAYSQLREISQDQNRRLAEVAESVLALAELDNAK